MPTTRASLVWRVRKRLRPLRRLWNRTLKVVHIVQHRGYVVLLRQADEVSVVRVLFAADAPDAPVLWRRLPQPLVTVHVPTYNRGRLVAERAIASALAQTHRNLEVLVVGDHCDEATQTAVLGVRDRRVRFENLEERGRYPSDPRLRWLVAGTAPMNRALELAQGEWLAPLDDDDELMPNHIEALLDACRSRSLEFAYGVALMEMAPGRWEELGSWPLRLGQIVHASVLCSSRLRAVPYAIDAWRLGEPGDWNRWHRIRDTGVAMGFVDEVVCRHYLEAREFRRYREA